MRRTIGIFILLLATPALLRAQAPASADTAATGDSLARTGPDSVRSGWETRGGREGARRGSAERRRRPEDRGQRRGRTEERGRGHEGNGRARPRRPRGPDGTHGGDAPRP